MIISRIPKLVQEKGLSLSELSRRMHITHRTAVKLFYADFTSIRIDTLDKLCTILKAQPGDIFVYIPGGDIQKPSLESAPEHTHPRNWRANHAHVLTEKVPTGG